MGSSCSSVSQLLRAHWIPPRSLRWLKNGPILSVSFTAAKLAENISLKSVKPSSSVNLGKKRCKLKGNLPQSNRGPVKCTVHFQLLLWAPLASYAQAQRLWLPPGTQEFGGFLMLCVTGIGREITVLYFCFSIYSDMQGSEEGEIEDIWLEALRNCMLPRQCVKWVGQLLLQTFACCLQTHISRVSIQVMGNLTWYQSLFHITLSKSVFFIKPFYRELNSS